MSQLRWLIGLLEAVFMLSNSVAYKGYDERDKVQNCLVYLSAP